MFEGNQALYRTALEQLAAIDKNVVLMLETLEAQNQRIDQLEARIETLFHPERSAMGGAPHEPITLQRQ
jgi:hypothetical protein